MKTFNITGTASIDDKGKLSIQLTGDSSAIPVLAMPVDDYRLVYNSEYMRLHIGL